MRNIKNVFDTNMLIFLPYLEVAIARPNHNIKLTHKRIYKIQRVYVPIIDKWEMKLQRYDNMKLVNVGHLRYMA
jgi:hypothetical protein